MSKNNQSKENQELTNQKNKKTNSNKLSTNGRNEKSSTIGTDSELRTIENLRGELLILFEQVKNQQVDLVKARTMSKIAHNILISAKVELDYNKYFDNKKEIRFLE